MKNIFFWILGLSFLIACSTKNNSNEAEASGTPALSHYGDSITATNALPVTVLADTMAETVDSLAVKLSGEILSTCSNKGCWMKMALANNKELRITFKDYSFFVPTEGVEGKTAIIKGYARKTITDIATLKHYAKDAGQSEEEINRITTPKEEIVFVASGVIIKD